MSPGETGRKTADRYTPLHTGGDTPRGSHREARPVCILWGCCWCYRDMFMELSIRRNREGMRVCVLGDRRREGGNPNVNILAYSLLLKHCSTTQKTAKERKSVFLFRLLPPLLGSMLLWLGWFHNMEVSTKKKIRCRHKVTFLSSKVCWDEEVIFKMFLA